MGTLCSFHKRIVACPLEPRTSPAMAFDKVYSTRRESPPMEQFSNFIRKKSVISCAGLNESSSLRLFREN